MLPLCLYMLRVLFLTLYLESFKSHLCLLVIEFFDIMGDGRVEDTTIFPKCLSSKITRVELLASLRVASLFRHSITPVLTTPG